MLLVVSCGGSVDGTDSTRDGRPLDPASWEEVVGLIDAKEGDYHKQVILTTDGSDVVVLQEWVTFDLRKKSIDRRVGLREDVGGVMEGSRADPALRFLYNDSQVLMWNPVLEDSCGTPWVEMPAERIEQLTGLSVSEDLYSIEPLEILREAQEPEGPVSSDENGTVYEAEVSGLAGIPVSSFMVENPELIGKLEEQDQSARIELPRKEEWIRIEVDLTEVMKAIQPASAGEEGVKMTWTVRAPLDVPELELPSRIGDSSCLNP